MGGILDDLENRLPENFNMFELRDKVVDETPYVSVVLQECARMNKLLTEMRRSMAELQLGLAGSLNMSDPMETLLSCMRLNRVAPNWEKNAYPSKKNLAMWYEDLLLRVQQLVAWSENLETPISVWLTALFNPMAYITAILQTTARANDLPLDQMDIWTDMPEAMEPSGVSAYPEEGMYIHGLFMEGARWDSKKNVVADSVPKELHPPVPVMHERVGTWVVLHRGYFRVPCLHDIYERAHLRVPSHAEDCREGQQVGSGWCLSSHERRLVQEWRPCSLPAQHMVKIYKCRVRGNS